MNKDLMKPSCPGCGMSRNEVVFKCGSMYVDVGGKKTLSRSNFCYEREIENLKKVISNDL